MILSVDKKRQIRKANTSPFTFNCDDDVLVEITSLIMDLRKNEYKSISKAFLFNTAMRYVLRLYDDYGLREVEKLIKDDYENFILKDE